MDQASTDRLIRAYARIQGLKNNLPTNFSVKEMYVTEYHEALEHLRGLGYDVEEFKVPEERIAKTPVSYSPTEGTKYSEHRYVERTFFLAKLDAVLTYFEMVTQKPSTSIGFKQSQS